MSKNPLDSWRPKPGDKPMRVERPAKLHRGLGLAGLFGSAYGDVGSSIYYALGVVAMSALGLTPIVLGISGILFLFTGLTYAEGTTALPESGGTGAFARRAFNDVVSFIASWALMLDYLVTIAISAFSAANYLGHFFPICATWPANVFVGIGIVAMLAGVNIAGIHMSSRLNIILVLIDIATEVTIAVFGILLIINIPRLINNVHWGVAPTLSQLLFGISISMVAYTGIETVSNLGSETRKPGRDIPRTVFLVFATVIILYSFLSMTALSAYPVYQSGNQWVTDLTQQFLSDPIMGIAYAMPEAFKNILSFWVGILAVTILIVATNAGIIGSSRLSYFMSVRQQLPSGLSSITRKSHVPYRAILLFSGLAALLITIGHISIMADLYAFGAMLAYSMAHISIIVLRVKEPNLPRPFKIPLNLRIRRNDIPVTAILGGLGTSITWFIVMFTHPYGRVVGFAWLGVGLLIYIIYRRLTHKPILGIAPDARLKVDIVPMRRRDGIGLNTPVREAKTLLAKLVNLIRNKK
jgi:APA family basic amino acid/polyamine antiporter